MEDVGGERRETFDVGVPGRRLDDPVASLVLVLRRTTGHLTKTLGKKCEAGLREAASPSRST